MEPNNRALIKAAEKYADSKHGFINRGKLNWHLEKINFIKILSSEEAKEYEMDKHKREVARNI